MMDDRVIGCRQLGGSNDATEKGHARDAGATNWLRLAHSVAG